VKAIYFLSALALAGAACLPSRRAPAPPAPAEMPPAAAAMVPAPAGPYALRRLEAGFYPTFRDDGDLADLEMAARRSIAYYRARPPGAVFQFGPDAYTAAHLADSLEAFITLLRKPPVDFHAGLRDQFLVYEATGTGDAGDVTFSAYYEHSLKASLKPAGEYRYPLYRPPPDLTEKAAAYTRRAIDSEGALKGKGLEIAWAKDPLDIFYLQVQGSGWLELPDGRRLRVRYAANNGQPYRSVGLHMIEKGLVPRKDFTREIMAAYLNGRPRERQEILNHNPRYVFFDLDAGPQSGFAFGSLRVPLTPWRSVATDPALFPRGALAWVEVPGEQPVTRFVVNQDEGGAIKGPARVDYFVGAEPEAEAFAVKFWRKGKIYFLVRKAKADSVP
jgi:membrane-bound lytic murein transglycosylase A